MLGLLVQSSKAGSYASSSGKLSPPHVNRRGLVLVRELFQGGHLTSDGIELYASFKRISCKFLASFRSRSTAYLPVEFDLLLGYIWRVIRVVLVCQIQVCNDLIPLPLPLICPYLDDPLTLLCISRPLHLWRRRS